MAAIHYASVWFLSMAVYYLVLGGLRAYLIVCYRRRTPDLERRCYLAAVSAEYPHGRHDRADGATGLRFFLSRLYHLSVGTLYVLLDNFPAV